jgi:hypothetical protein
MLLMTHYFIHKKKKGGQVIMPIQGKIIGNIHINVCKTPSGSTFYCLNADNKEVVPVLDYIENRLNHFKD